MQPTMIGLSHSRNSWLARSSTAVALLADNVQFKSHLHFDLKDMSTSLTSIYFNLAADQADML